ncbi:MAG: ABC transporter ATP-binding protein [Desulfococcaceae bacterium]|jgi:ATP-binding cassette subfamily B protein|nr:ABC transporter ATP-binding protein [Desulfococcaceae bacterium]
MKTFDLIRPYFVKNRYSILLGLLSLIAVDLMQLVIPRIIRAAVDELTTFRTDAAGLLRYALWITCLAVFMVFLRYLWRYWLMGMSRELEEGLRNRLFGHLQTLSASYFSRITAGDMMAHATNDIHQIRMAAGMGLVAVTDSFFMGMITIGFMMYINVRLTLFVLIPMPLIVFCTRFFSRQMHVAYLSVQSTFSDMTEIVRERFAGIRIVKAYNREAESVSAVEKISRENMRHNLRLTRTTGAFFPMMIFFTNLSLTIVLWMGGRETIYSRISPGDFVAFISYLGMLTWPMMALGWVINLIQRGKASLQRIAVIIRTLPEITDAPHARPFRAFQKEIRMENVCFSYDSASGNEDKRGKTPVLRNINLSLEKGKTLGIVGPPGSGKSSLLQLLPRIYDIAADTRGSICIDGRDIRDMPLADLRNLISFVPQEPFLFAGSIRENIAFGNPDVSETQLAEALRKSALEETIASFPKGLDTIVGEKGVILSGGQKQRIALARALLRDAPILILDDPVSQVDAETGTAIIRTIRDISLAPGQQRTVIIVSHRLSALRFADRIISLSEGEIQESGSHGELMAGRGYYARTWYLQEIEEGL